MKKVVLVVDDDKLIIRLYKRLFRINDCNMLSATTCSEAKGLLKDGKFDLAIVDVKLPDGDGFEVLDMIRKNPALKNMTVVMLSGFFTDSKIKKRCQENGVECIEKGVESPTDIVKELLKKF